MVSADAYGALLSLSAKRGLDAEEYLRRALELCVDFTTSEIGYLHFVNRDQLTLDLHLWSEATLRHCRIVQDRHYPLKEAGIWADCVRQRRPVIHNRYASLADAKGLPPGHFPVQRHMSVPVIEDGLIRLVVGVGNALHPYDEDQALKLQAYATHIWLIVSQRQAIADLRKSEERLQAELARAEEASRAKTQFLAHMSHELRTPLNAILGFSQLLEMQPMGPLGHPRYLEYLDDIQNSGRDLLSLINDVLNMAHLDEDSVSLAREPVDLLVEVEEVVEIMAATARLKGLVLAIDRPAFPCLARANERAVKQVLINLIGNALRYVPQGGQCRLGFERDPFNGMLRVVVRDNGPGIDSGRLSQVGAPFSLRPDIHLATEEGAGLGLAISARLAQSMGGDLTIEAGIPTGTVARLTLPALLAVERQGHPASL